MKQDKMAIPGLYLQLFKLDGETHLEVATWIREDYMAFWAQPSHEYWCTLMWNLAPRKGWEKKSEAIVKKDYVTWWEKFDTLDDLRQRVKSIKEVPCVGAGGEIPDLLLGK